MRLAEVRPVKFSPVDICPAEVFADKSKGKIQQRETMEVAHLGIHEAIAKIIEC